jgi:probable F420-dependent oxidoreductase
MAGRPFRFGVVAAGAASGDAWLAKARRVEDLGFDTLLMPDRLGPLLSPLPALAAVAAVTQRLRLGTFVLASGWRHPVMVARDCATLQFLSNGRFEPGFGAGVGGEDVGRAGLPVESPGARVDRLAEMLAVVKGLLSGRDAAGARAVLPPVQGPPPPILVAAAGQRSLALAAREADIVALSVRPTEGEDALAATIDRLRREAGERFPQIELSINLVAVIGDEPLPPQVGARLRSLFGLDAAQLAWAGSPFVVAGTTDEMCAQLIARRERLGISYVTVPDDLMEPFAPVVARLAGR